MHRLKWSAEHQDGALVVRIAGDVDLVNASDFDRILHTALAEDSRWPAIIDLTGITYMDTHGLRVLERIATQAPAVLVRPSPYVHRLITFLDRERKIRLAE